MSDANGFSFVPLYKLMGFVKGLFAVQTFRGSTWATLPLYLKELTGSKLATGMIITDSAIERISIV